MFIRWTRENSALYGRDEAHPLGLVRLLLLEYCRITSIGAPPQAPAK
jgi:hypothetical protein